MNDDRPLERPTKTSLDDRAVARGDIRDRTLTERDRPLGERERLVSDGEGFAAGADRVAGDDHQGERGEGHGPLGVHPVGTALGGVAGAVAAGAAVGSVAGPIGAAVGAAIGAAAGGMAGKLVADLADPQLEDEFWRKNWSDRHYIDGGFTYDQDYRSAYMYGVDTYNRYPDRSYDELEPELETGWRDARGDSRLEWGNARHATRDAWQRASDRRERAVPGDPDGDLR